MAESIFGAEAAGLYRGAFRTTLGTALSFGGGPLTLIQNIQVSHQQPVQPLFEVGSNARYYVVGKASGTFSATQILGFGSAALDQVVALADPCSGERTLTLVIPNAFCDIENAAANAGNSAARRAGAATADTGTLTLNLKGVLLTSTGFSVAAQDNLINSQLQGLLTDLEYEYA
jgi:hypothetical protein